MAGVDLTLTDNTDQNRYEAHLGGELAGYLEYQLTDDLMVISHTEVLAAHEGHGVGSALARHVLDDVDRNSDRSVIVLCPFVLSWLERHPDYQRLVYGRRPRNDQS